MVPVRQDVAHQGRIILLIRMSVPISPFPLVLVFIRGCLSDAYLSHPDVYSDIHLRLLACLLHAVHVSIRLHDYHARRLMFDP